MKKFIVRDRWGYCISETDVEGKALNLKKTKLIDKID